jgi:hypothetical protein
MSEMIQCVASSTVNYSLLNPSFILQILKDLRCWGEISKLGAFCRRKEKPLGYKEVICSKIHPSLSYRYQSRCQ